VKQMGAIPADYRARNGQLLVGGRTAEELVSAAGGTPLFVYDFELVEARVARFRRAFPSIALHYALKANPFGPLVQRIVPLVDGIDIASIGEALVAIGSGAAPDRLSFAGPGKRDAELEAAIARGVPVTLESENEAARLLAIADSAGVRPRVAVRVNPDFELRGSGMRMGGAGPSRSASMPSGSRPWCAPWCRAAPSFAASTSSPGRSRWTPTPSSKRRARRSRSRRGWRRVRAWSL
jgi:diaminopimelate decarboxylase